MHDLEVQNKSSDSSYPIPQEQQRVVCAWSRKHLYWPSTVLLCVCVCVLGLALKKLFWVCIKKDDDAWPRDAEQDIWRLISILHNVVCAWSRKHLSWPLNDFTDLQPSYSVCVCVLGLALKK